MEKRDKLYEGKAKRVYATDDPQLLIVEYKDDATAFNGLKRSSIDGKGVINNKVTNFLMQLIEREGGIPTHFVRELSGRETLVKKAATIPLEVVVRNIVAGSLVSRLGVPEGTVLSQPVLEYAYKSDDLGDPMVNEYHIAAMGWVSKENLAKLAEDSLRINEILKGCFKHLNIDLVDFKLEYGFDENGQVMLVDEISPDTCRFWDSVTHEKLDKDRFRRDLGGVVEAYQEIIHRLMDNHTEG